jgi:hypothetical protein
MPFRSEIPAVHGVSLPHLAAIKSRSSRTASGSSRKISKQNRALSGKNQQKRSMNTGSRNRSLSGSRSTSESDSSLCDDTATTLQRQPEQKPITEAQLVPEVKTIYSALLKLENKCIEIDKEMNDFQRAGNQIPHKNWVALTDLHRRLLNEHVDFFLASQHPAASDTLKKLVSKYSMGARLWKHGIHTYLELMRGALPSSLDFMIRFLYMVYSLLSMLLEVVPAFKVMWMECMGDIARYLMAIEVEDWERRDIWCRNARNW